MARDFNFLVDTYSGIDTWIQVENGKIIKFRNSNEKFLSKLNEIYLGKEISFFKEDFTNRMKPSWLCVKSLDYVDAVTTLEALKNQLDRYKTYLHRVLYRDKMVSLKDFTPEQVQRITDFEQQIYDAKLNVKATEFMLKEVHNYTVIK